MAWIPRGIEHDHTACPNQVNPQTASPGKTHTQIYKTISGGSISMCASGGENRLATVHASQDL